MNSNDRPFRDDSLLQRINSSFVSLRDQDITRNNEVLQAVLKEVVETLKQKNNFCGDYLGDIKFVGSFYKGTKVGKPEEFDLNVVFQLPLKYELIKFENDTPGFIKLKVTNECYKPEWERHKQLLDKLVTPEGYLDQDEFRRCIESALEKMPTTVTVGNKKYELKLKKSGPAFTLKLFVKEQSALEMCVDLVPVLEFTKQPPTSRNISAERKSKAKKARNLRKKLEASKNSGDSLSTSFDSLRVSTAPKRRNRSNRRRKGHNQRSWYAVPKAGKNLARPNIYWRMSFYSREQDLLKKYQHLKNVIRLLKKLRDTEGWTVLVSYHLETLVLHRIETMNRNPELQKKSLTEHFVDMLRELKKACETREILNFWNKSHNLIGNLEPGQLMQLASINARLEMIIRKIENDPSAIADFMLTKDERKTI